jgi:hypothetical protein
MGLVLSIYLLKITKYYYVAKLSSSVLMCLLNLYNQHNSYLTQYNIYVIFTGCGSRANTIFELLLYMFNLVHVALKCTGTRACVALV